MPEEDVSARHRLMWLATRTAGTSAVPDAPGWAALRSVSLAEPEAIHSALSTVVGTERRVVVTGTLDRRLVLIEGSTGSWTVADLSGRAHHSRTWPAWTSGHLIVTEPSRWLSPGTLTPQGLRRLLRPRLLLVSLYHPEHFPLPRFPLAISDLARAARATLLGQVELMDMQLGVSLDDIIGRVRSGGVDVFGVSVTFGQHDLFIHLLDEVTSLDEPPVVVAGGSLTARNERMLLQRYPRLLIGRAAGEPTIQDVLAYWHGDMLVEQIRGAGYRGSTRGAGALTIGPARRTATVANRLQTDIWPELDLLDATFGHKGVAQLEVSRGCTNFCSFCPRGHKGQWAGAAPDALPWLLREIGSILDRHPRLSRTVYLVDEEFIGRGDDAVPRALALADTLDQAGFGWETSCRVDQVARLDRDRDWHIERGHLWRRLVERRLRRCLFGVESGVTSILQRFNKETTADQNVLAIRTLTALGVPPRFTYITFDQLMTSSELRDTYLFQGRTDLLLDHVPQMSVEQIIDGVRDDGFVAEHSSGQPFYTAISYMLVGMECLIGAAYTRKAEAAGLTGLPDPSMGRVDTRYADWRIGVVARWAQLWIDRNFALDYTLKSLEKIIDGQPHQLVRGARGILKRAAYRLLGAMIDALDHSDILDADHTELHAGCAAVADNLLDEMRADLVRTLDVVEAHLAPTQRDLLQREHQRWAATTTWTLINAADPCGT